MADKGRLQGLKQKFLKRTANSRLCSSCSMSPVSTFTQVGRTHAAPTSRFGRPNVSNGRVMQSTRRGLIQQTPATLKARQHAN